MGWINKFTKIFSAIGLLFSSASYSWRGNNGAFSSDWTFDRPSFQWREDDPKFQLWSGAGGEFLLNGEGFDKNGHSVGLYQYNSEAIGNFGPAEHWSSILTGSNAGLSSGQLVDLNAAYGPGSTPATIAAEGSDAVVLKAERKDSSFVYYSALATSFQSIPGTWTLSGNSLFRFISVTNPSAEVIKAIPNGITLEKLLEQGIALSPSTWNPSAAVGDVTVMLDWQNWFDQNGEFLKSVGIMVGLGLVIPTASALDTKNLWAVDIGNGEAFHARFLGRVDAKFNKNTYLIGELLLDVPFDRDIKRRLKRTMSDSELFLPEAVACRISQGNFFRLSGYAHFATEDGAYWGRLGYQYGKRGTSTVATEASYLANQQLKRYEPTVVNTAAWLAEADYQNFVASAGMDFSRHSPKLSPQIKFGLLWPAKGSNVAAFKALTASLTISF